MTTPTPPVAEFIRDGKCRYRNGEPARILCTDAPCDTPIVALDGEGFTSRHYADGTAIQGFNDLDLVPITTTAQTNEP